MIGLKCSTFGTSARHTISPAMSGNSTRKLRSEKEKESEEQQPRDADLPAKDANMSDISKRFTMIENLIQDLKSSLMAKYDEIDCRLNTVMKSQEFLCGQYESFRKVVDTSCVRPMIN